MPQIFFITSGEKEEISTGKELITENYCNISKGINYQLLTLNVSN